MVNKTVNSIKSVKDPKNGYTINRNTEQDSARNDIESTVPNNENALQDAVKGSLLDRGDVVSPMVLTNSNHKVDSVDGLTYNGSMRNIERCGFSNVTSSLEYAAKHNLGNPASWGTQVWIDYTRWLTEESVSNATVIPEGVDQSQVNHPKHYQHKSGFDAIVWIDRYSMDFCTGNCFKYLFRRGLKPGEACGKDEEKAKWYFLHEAIRYSENDPGLTWEDAKKKVFEKLNYAFGPAGRKPDENGNPTEDWTKGGCDMPEAIEFLQKECLTLLKDGTKSVGLA